MGGCGCCSGRGRWVRDGDRDRRFGAGWGLPSLAVWVSVSHGFIFSSCCLSVHAQVSAVTTQPGTRCCVGRSHLLGRRKVQWGEGASCSVWVQRLLWRGCLKGNGNAAPFWSGVSLPPSHTPAFLLRRVPHLSRRTQTCRYVQLVCRAPTEAEQPVLHLSCHLCSLKDLLPCRHVPVSQGQGLFVFPDYFPRCCTFCLAAHFPRRSRLRFSSDLVC